MEEESRVVETRARNDLSYGIQESRCRRVRLGQDQEYEGEMLGDLPHGNGVLYQRGQVYFSGSFKFGKFSGYGTLYNLDYRAELVDYKKIDISSRNWNRF